MAGATEAHLDDEYLVQCKHQYPTAGANLVTDGDFEVDPNIWWTPSNCTITNVTGGQDGGKCLKATGNGNNFTISANLGLMTIGKTTGLSFYVLSGTSGNQPVEAYVSDGVGTHIASGTSGALWTQYSIAFTPKGIAGSITLWQLTNVAGTMFFDDVVVQTPGLPRSGTLLNNDAYFKSCGVSVGAVIYNDTDGSNGIITAVTENSVTCTLAGGVNNFWSYNDVASIYKTATKDSYISKITTDRSRGWKVTKPIQLDTDGFFPEDADMDRHEKHVWNPNYEKPEKG